MDNNTANEKIKSYYIIEGKKDKFTKITTFHLKNNILLSNESVKDYINNFSDDLKTSIYTKLDIKYLNNDNEDALIFETSLRLTIYTNPIIYTKIVGLNMVEPNRNLLNSKILQTLNNFENDSNLIVNNFVLLLDENELIKLEFVKNNIANDIDTNIGITSKEHISEFKLDISTLIKIVKANKIEYRISSENYNVIEGSIKANDKFKLIGFYNAMFDDEFFTSELLNHIEKEMEKEEIEKKEKEKKAKLEREKLERNVREGQEKLREIQTKESSCFVITATMGDSNHPIVEEFRNYRDNHLLTNTIGKLFVEFYYKVGPYMAKLIEKNEKLRKFSFKYFVLPIYNKLTNGKNINKE